MLNQIVLVGRLAKSPELRVTDSGKKMATITLAVPRSFKNSNGEYDTDFLDCTLWTGVAENTAEYCQTGDMLGVRGRVQNRYVEKEDGSKVRKTEIIADKVTFLTTSPGNKSSEELKKDVSDALEETKKTKKSIKVAKTENKKQ